MAADAKKLREDAATKAKKKLEEASDAGIQNRSWWEEGIDWVSDNWDTIVAVCKVVVAIVGIIAMIIGGPILAAIVVVAALVVLADTINKYLKGQATLLDVAFAALDCIPGMKGLTTLGGLARGLKGMAKGLRSGGLKALRKGADDAIGKSKPTNGRCKGGDPIDMVSGEMLMEETDVELPGLLPLVLRRTHVSTYRWGRWFGESWASTIDERLELDNDGALFATEDGMILVYPVPAPGTSVMPLEGPRWPLDWDGEPGAPIRITDPRTGHTRHFAPLAKPAPADSAFTMPLAAISDRNGHCIEFDRDEFGVPTAVRHSGGYHVHVDTEDDRITRLRLANPEDGPDGTTLLRYGYNAEGHLTEIYNSSGLPFKLSYDDRARITSWTDRNNSWYRFTYDDRDRCIRGEGIDGILDCTISYDTDGRITRYTNSLGHTTTYRYNEQLQLVASTNALDQSVTNEWDRYNRLLAQTDALGNTTRYAYDHSGNLTTIARADGSSTEATYNELHQLVRAIMPNGAVWQQTYDERGNHTSTIDPSGSEISYAYDAAGGLVAVTDPTGRTSHAVCDGTGLPVEFTDVQGAVSSIERDAFGRVSTITDAVGRTTRFGRTVEGKVLWRETPDGYREFWEWDAEGNLVSETDRAGNVNNYSVGAFGQVSAHTLGDGTQYSFSYDSELNLLRVADPQERTWQYAYDAANRVMSETDFSGRTLTYEVDAMGELISRTNGAGQTIRFNRDALGRTVEMIYDGHAAHYLYDASGNLVREVGPDVTVEREYNAVGLLLSESINGRATAYDYDALGRRIRRRTPTGIESTWTYDAAGHPIALEAAGHRIAFEFDEAHRETARHLPGSVTLTQSWDRAGQLTTQRLTHVPGEAETLLQYRTYAYRPDGVPIEIEELTSGTRHFTLDPRGRVTVVDARRWTERYTYDTVGNITRAVTPGADDGEADRTFIGTRIQRSGRTHYKHDAEGRIVRTVLRLLNGQKRVQSYTWNSQSQLVATTTPDGTTWRYTYDPAGRRVAKQRLDDGGNVADETFFVWDGARLIEQITTDGHATSWDYAPGSHLPVAQLDRPARAEIPCPREYPDDLGKWAPQAEMDARFHAIVTDLSGAPSELISADGELAWQQRTTLWGTSLPAHLQEGGADGVDCPLRFPGQYKDAETGWHYNYQRYYDPQTGQYATPDPLGLAPSPHDTAYVPNPYTWIDPLGLHWQDPNNGMRFGRDPSLPEGERQYTRDNQYPSEYRQSTHDHMTRHYTDEGRAQGRTPVDASGNRIPRDQLTWRDGRDRVIWNPQADNPRPFNRTVTYEHRDPVVQHWNREGRFSDRATRNDFYNDTRHMEPMHWSQNSREGGRMTATYSQEVGEGYSCS
ncbi:DUF6531 domain-containing protein [Streptomyces sp. 8N616]|uniref:DUF6531 domain-containing protein n=1 Tax=Streptomyces sp. 8N616 TaxID=3457414 RepID=UPI003FD2E399